MLGRFQLSPEDFRHTSLKINKVLFVFYALALLAIVVEYGFFLDQKFVVILRAFEILGVVVFIAQQMFKLVYAPNRSVHFRERKLEYFISLLIVVISVLFFILDKSDFESAFHLKPINFFALYIICIQVVIGIDILSSVIRYSHKIASLHIQPARLFVVSFVLLIIAGTLALMLPKATTHGITFLDALFTSTSAVCVTGLIVVDTASAFTPLGKFIIMMLIQIGGLGVMTFTTFFTLFSGKFGIRDRALMQELLSSETVGEIRSTLLTIISVTFLVEAVGAFALYYSWGEGVFEHQKHLVFNSIFHSVSAFCNAGFSLFPHNLGDPRLAMNVPVNLTVALLIILGGIGFPVIMNVMNLALKRRRGGFVTRLSIHTRLAVVTTVILIGGGMALLLLFELPNSLAALTPGERMLASFFQSVTLRTAGFNTIDIAAMGAPALLICMLWMFIGASPGSTGGGVKTTTLSVTVLATLQSIRGKKNIEITHRTIPFSVVDRAYAVIAFHFSLIFLSVLLVASVEHFNLVDIAFECFSAAGTVGLSRGITGALSDFSKFIITLTMLSGRVGVVTLLMALTRKAITANYDYPSEHIIVG